MTVLGSLFLMVGGTLTCMLVAQADSSISVSVSVITNMLINVTAIPEKRIPSTGNDATSLKIEVRNPGSTTALTSTTVTTSANGTASNVSLNVNAGTYDVTGKGYSHLRRKKSNVALINAFSLDFTDTGTNKLLSGDVNSTDGDNKVNGIDLTLIVNALTTSDGRTDLNQDTLVNGIDLTNAVSNLTLTGDE